MNDIKMGSLFDGSAGFPLAGVMYGMTPVWASEVEPYPIRVTTKRLPSMKHYGDISKMNGAEIEPVDVITGGSPCQDMSVAGKRAGLDGERSCLFREQIRIIKEMREATNGQYPRYMVWENVPGAFSSNKGDDFRCVLEETARIKDAGFNVPMPEKNKWSTAGLIMGDGFSIGWRVLDAQYWGVPQRRRRIFLVADFSGTSAGEILFKREGLRGYFAEGRTPWKTVTGDVENRTGTADSEGKSYGIVSKGNGEAWPIEEKHMALSCGGGQAGQGYPCAMVPYLLKIRSGCEGRVRTADSERECVGVPASFYPQMKAESQCFRQDNVANTIVNGTNPGFQNGVVYAIVDSHILDDQGGSLISIRNDGKSPTLRAEMHGNVPSVMEPVTLEPGIAAREGGHIYEGVSGTLRANAGDNQIAVAYAIEKHPADSRVNIDDSGKVPMVMEPRVYESHPMDSRIKELEGTAPTVSVKWHKGAAGTPLVMETIPIHDQATRFSGKRGENYDGKGNGLGVGNPGDPMNTLTSGDRHAVAYLASGKDATGTLMASMAEKQCLGDQEAFSGDYHIIEENPIVLDRAFYNQGVNAQYDPQLYEDGTVPTLVAKGPSAVCVRYIVRRLTPLECARLQGFPDWWTADLGTKDEDITEEMMTFWREVFETHRKVVTGASKPKTDSQIRKWLVDPDSDAAEYKMWGNGVALPCVLYVMEGIADVLGKGGVADGSTDK